MVKAIVAGAAGRMGGRIINIIHETEGIELGGAFERPDCPHVGQDAGVVAGVGELGVQVEDSLEKVLDKGDVIIDFTFHEASLNHARVAAEAKKPMVIGTTGFTDDELREVHSLAQGNFPLVQAYNMSTGINLLYKLVELTAKVLGQGYDIEIIEAHHRMKKDAPSGTAIKLLDVASNAMGWKKDECARFCREGLIGERPQQEIGVQTIRGGDIVGEHTVLFAGIGERVELTHRASSRDTFAKGAVRAALWVVDKSPGVYDMHDVLGLR